MLREAFRKGTLGAVADLSGISQRLTVVAAPEDGAEAPPSQSLWIVLVARRAILAAGIAEVQDEFDTLLRALLPDDESTR